MRWVVLTTVALVVAVAAAFTIQNSSFEAPLQLDLYVAAWRLAEPASVPLLMWASFAVGGLFAGGVLGARSARLASRVRQLESEIAVGGSKSASAKDPWAAG
jgi:uncharacterized integral membrane protein